MIKTWAHYAKIYNKFFIIIGLILTIILGLFIWLFPENVFGQINEIKRLTKKIYYQASTIVPSKPTIKLAVEFHKQEHALSCEVASLVMALNFKGSEVTESQLISFLPISDPKPRDQKNNLWGDPNLGFVGDINGKMPNTGYGVYDKPIYNLAINFRPAKIIKNGDVNILIEMISNNNPVIVWGVAGSGKDISWQTKEGKKINAHYIEHARLLIGFTGSKENPHSLILLDPIYGEIKMTTKNFIKNWEIMDKMAIAIY